MSRSIVFLCAAAFGAASLRAQTLPPPPNDEPAGAVALIPGEPLLATTAGAAPSTPLVQSCVGAVWADVFFSFVPSVSGAHVFSTAAPLDAPVGTLVEHRFFLHDATNVATPLACSVAPCWSGGWTLAHTLTAGATYLVRVARTGVVPDGTFFVAVIPPPPVPLSDACASAPSISLGYTQVALAGTTASNPSPVCAAFANWTQDVFGKFTAPLTGRVRIHRQAAELLAVYTGACGAEVPAPGVNTCVHFVDVGSTFTSFDAVAGVEYLIRVGSNQVGSTALGWIQIDYALTSTVVKTPVGPGTASVALDVVGGGAFDLVVHAITLHQGAFPFGWFYGVDLPFAELWTYPTLGAPFVMVLSGAGTASYFLPSIPDPLGATFYAVAVTFDASLVKKKHSASYAFTL
jgi:hypothetical protein